MEPGRDHEDPRLCHVAAPRTLRPTARDDPVDPGHEGGGIVVDD